MTVPSIGLLFATHRRATSLVESNSSNDRVKRPIIGRFPSFSSGIDVLLRVINEKNNLTEQTAKKQVKDTAVLNDLIIDAIQDIKGKHIKKLDLRKLDDASADFFIICEGDSTTQVKAIADNVYQRVKDELGIIPAHREGVAGARWVLVDYFDTVVHVFYPETRAFYELEELWSDAEITEYEDL